MLCVDDAWVLNLVINGIPSILQLLELQFQKIECFKPCYKWNTFNTQADRFSKEEIEGFKPCYKWNTFNTVIGSPPCQGFSMSFKPCYKWNTFNTRFP